ncbi:hypothetical protein [Glycomyces xiaoerkulensis]|uniref:hypothetical protein n=1 Tax=Glycomyces xiaoerkulensis TaxID=2038139 RepID=UPI00130002B6|nr:hypothetical protein [Glycomyces xiaoerkulensis]
MSNPQQPPADGWQPPPPPEEGQPVYRPNEQPPTEESPPWSPESRQAASSSPPDQEPPVEDDGTIKYTSAPPSQPQGRPQAPFGPPPGVPVSPFDSPAPPPGMPPGGPAPGMPPVSSAPASGMPVSPGQQGQQGQFGPQGGQLVPLSGPPGGQPWGGAQPGRIRRKRKGSKTPLWILLAGIVVIAGALGVGGFILFNPADPGGSDEPTGTIESPEAAEPVVKRDGASGLSFLADGSWTESSDAPPVFTESTGSAAEDGSAAFVGTLDAEALEIDEDMSLGDIGAALDTQVATFLEAEIEGDVTATAYRVDGRTAEFRTFTIADWTVLTAVVATDEGHAAFTGFATADQTEALEAARHSLGFGE